MALLEVRNVTKFYQAEGKRVPALQDVSFDLDAGEFVALVGRSGSGKSTLLNLCGAMDFPSSGEIVFNGQVTTKLDDARLTRLRRENVGFVFQSFQLIQTLTAVENVELPLLLARKSEARRRALERLRWLEMDDYAERFPHQLSGGEQQRVAIARALVHDPLLLLADEPTGNLDTVTGEMVVRLLSRAVREFGVALIMATHSAENIAEADRVFEMRDGKLQDAAVAR